MFAHFEAGRNVGVACSSYVLLEVGWAYESTFTLHVMDGLHLQPLGSSISVLDHLSLSDHVGFIRTPRIPHARPRRLIVATFTQKHDTSESYLLEAPVIAPTGALFQWKVNHPWSIADQSLISYSHRQMAECPQEPQDSWV